MNSFDLILRGGTVVTEKEIISADIGVSEGRITEISENLSGTAPRMIDCSGVHIFAGVIDSHVHFNEPGRAEWEGITTGSRAVAAGGGTLFFDMPLNAHPPTVDRDSFRLKQAAAKKNSLVDFALWGGLVPENLPHLEALAECGVIGFKAFMSNSGIADFNCVDDHTLREGMKRAAALRLPVAVHAESDALTSALAAKARAHGRTSVRDYLQSRPIQAELDAIERALAIAKETGCALHVVHVSSAAGVQRITAARANGIDVSCETCPHYLALTEEDMVQMGALAKCAPPLRSAEEQEKLWQELIAGNILTIGSDHSPAPPEMKTAADFFQVWGGISGAQHLLPILLTLGGAERSIDLASLSRLCSANVARRFGLAARKGSVASGYDADLALVQLDETYSIEPADLQYRHRQSPYVGRSMRGRVKQTLLRGETVFKDGQITAPPAGRLVRPTRF